MKLIDADALWHRTFCCEDAADVRKEIETAPTVDAVEVVHGRWLPTSDPDKKRCSECDVIHLIAQYPHGAANYCPNCSAKMDGREDNEA